jgi:broad specificity phosphatase PhoE
MHVLIGHHVSFSLQKRFPASENESLNMLGVIQARKVAELLLDITVDLLLSGPADCSKCTADHIAEVSEL